MIVLDGQCVCVSKNIKKQPKIVVTTRMASSGEVREGFLCPICMADLHDVIQLQVHFEEEHDKEDPAFIQNLKDLFGKAKKKILNEDNNHQVRGESLISKNSDLTNPWYTRNHL